MSGECAMSFDELRAKLLMLPEATPEWAAYTVSFPNDGRPLLTSHSLVDSESEAWVVFEGDGRGGTFPATNEDGITALAFQVRE